MKILKPGNALVWSLDQSCTGRGNNTKGCNALLELELADLRWFQQIELPWRTQPEAVTFRCICCGKTTDLNSTDWPSNHHTLPRWSSKWRDTGIDGNLGDYSEAEVAIAMSANT